MGQKSNSDGVKVEIRDLSEFRPLRDNPNKHTQRGLRTLENAMQEVGYVAPITVAGDGESLDGAARLETSYDRLGPEAIVVEHDGSRPVVMVRSDIPNTQTDRAKKIIYGANRIAELDLDWDVEALAADLDAGLDLSGLWTDLELEELGLELDADDLGAWPGQVFDDDEIVESAFHYFRGRGFPYRELPVHVSMQQVNKLAATEVDKLLNTTTAYHVADTYHPHRLHAVAEGMKSPFEAFQDKRLLFRALNLQMEQNGSVPAGYFGKLDIVSGTQACSNFRPGFACYLYRKYCRPGDTVLDCSTGYGGRLVGFMASGVAGRYIGIDPNEPTHQGNTRMSEELDFDDKVELYNLPAEDVNPDDLRGRCDFAFTSPPYFAKEHYSEDDTQSWVRYQEGEDWRVGFLEPFMALQFAALKPGARALVNIADVKLRGRTFSLVEWAINAGQVAGFEHECTDEYQLANRFGGGQPDEVATEAVLVFRKSEASMGLEPRLVG